MIENPAKPGHKPWLCGLGACTGRVSGLDDAKWRGEIPIHAGKQKLMGGGYYVFTRACNSRQKRDTWLSGSGSHLLRAVTLEYPHGVVTPPRPNNVIFVATP